jgi:energy-converting hydrogenase A subunit R
MNNYICFDLEGPLTPQDNAYDLMKLFPNGDRVFEIASRYDDLLTLEGREGYEPGDTLALIVPFLVLHGISEADIAGLAERATLIGGSAELVSWLKDGGWKVFCITTTYRQYATIVTRRLGIATDNIACTPFPLDRYQKMLCKEDIALLQNLEREVLAMSDDDEAIRKKLDSFFRRELPKTGLGRSMARIKPIGGRRKVAALNRFSQKNNVPLSKWVVVGDSITDFRMLKAVDIAGGLAIAFNANLYALPYATMSLASTSINDLTPVLAEWQKGGRDGAEKMLGEKEKAGGGNDREHFHWLSGRKDIADVITLHHGVRGLVRKEAGKLG